MRRRPNRPCEYGAAADAAGGACPDALAWRHGQDMNLDQPLAMCGDLRNTLVRCRPNRPCQCGAAAAAAGGAGSHGRHRRSINHAGAAHAGHAAGRQWPASHALHCVRWNAWHIPAAAACCLAGTYLQFCCLPNTIALQQCPVSNYSNAGMAITLSDTCWASCQRHLLWYTSRSRALTFLRCEMIPVGT